MNKCILFPGQGSQIIGMGKDIYDNFTIARDIFQEVDDALNQKLSDIIFNGPTDLLTQTANTQPALMVVSMAILKVLEAKLGEKLTASSKYYAGHSLGEYTALCASNMFSISDTAKLLRIRGSSMQAAVPEGKGAMAAILGMEIDEIEQLCSQSSDFGICQIANDNCPGQVVISGALKAVDMVIEKVAAAGKKAIKLAVSAPFHCDMIKSVSQIMQSALEETTYKAPEVPIICNYTATESNIPSKIITNLTKQVYSRVRWRESMNYLIDKKIDNFIEIGSGKVLTGMMKRINKDVKTTNISSLSDINSFLNS
jgi:[acyl-carrier-protein] S-malonyltransferase